MSSQANAKISPTGGRVTAALVAKAAAGDRDAFATIYNEHHTAVFCYLVHRTRNRDLAEDLTSETFVRALRNIGTFSERSATGGVGGWLYTIARNLHTDHLKSAKTRLEVSTEDFFEFDERYDSAESSALRELEAVEAAASVKAAMKGLTPCQRQCVEMRYIRELSLAETAAALGKRHGAVKTLTFRAMAGMRDALTSEAVAA